MAVVEFLDPHTQEPKLTWRDALLTNPAPAQQSPDADGYLTVFGVGEYEMVVSDAQGAQQSRDIVSLSTVIAQWSLELAQTGLFDDQRLCRVGNDTYILQGDAQTDPTEEGQSDWDLGADVIPRWKAREEGEPVRYSVQRPFAFRQGDLYALRDGSAAASDPAISPGWANLTAPRMEAVSIAIPAVRRVAGSPDGEPLTDEWATVHTVNISDFREIGELCVLFAYVHSDTNRAISVRFISESAVAEAGNAEINGITGLVNGQRGIPIPISEDTGQGESASGVELTDFSTLTLPAAALPSGTVQGDIVAQRGSGARGEIVSMSKANNVYTIRLRRLGEDVRHLGTFAELTARYGLNLDGLIFAVGDFTPQMFRTDMLDAIFREAKLQDSTTAFAEINYGTQRNSTVLHVINADMIFANTPADALSAPLRIQMRTDSGQSPLRITGGEVRYSRRS